MEPGKVLILLCAGLVMCVQHLCWEGNLSYEKQALKEKENTAFHSPRLDSTLFFIIIYMQAPLSVRDAGFCLSVTPGNALLCQESVRYACV